MVSDVVFGDRFKMWDHLPRICGPSREVGCHINGLKGLVLVE